MNQEDTRKYLKHNKTVRAVHVDCIVAATHGKGRYRYESCRTAIAFKNFSSAIWDQLNHPCEEYKSFMKALFKRYKQQFGMNRIMWELIPAYRFALKHTQSNENKITNRALSI